MSRAVKISIVCFVLAALSLDAATLYVDSAATGANNGTSWANAWTNLPASGPSAGDVVYISGGASGGSQTYDITAPYWDAPHGNASARVTYQIGQDASHNGTAIFNYTGASPGSTAWLSGPRYVTVSGDAGDGANHFKLTGWTNDVVSNVRAFKLEYVTATNGLNGFADLRADGGATTNIELNHLWIRIDGAQASRGIYGAFQGGAAWDDSVIHHCTIELVRDANGFGPDGLALGNTSWSLHDNLITSFAGTYSGGQHQDGWQGLYGSNLKIYNNTIVDMSNYALFGEAYGGGWTNVYVYNNLILIATASLNTGYPGGIVFGTSSGFVPAPPCVFTNVVIANNTVVDYGTHGPAALNNVTATTTYFQNCRVQNNVAVNCGALGLEGNGTSLTNYNVSLTAGNAPANFVSYATYGGTANNLRLLAGASGLIGQGTDLSAYFTGDILGATRAVPWDVGAYEYASAASPSANFNSVTIVNLRVTGP